MTNDDPEIVPGYLQVLAKLGRMDAKLDAILSAVLPVRAKPVGGEDDGD